MSTYPLLTKHKIKNYLYFLYFKYCQLHLAKSILFICFFDHFIYFNILFSMFWIPLLLILLILVLIWNFIHLKYIILLFLRDQRYWCLYLLILLRDYLPKLLWKVNCFLNCETRQLPFKIRKIRIDLLCNIHTMSLNFSKILFSELIKPYHQFNLYYS